MGVEQWCLLLYSAYRPAERSYWEMFGFVILELPQWQKSALLFSELIWRILKVFKI